MNYKDILEKYGKELKPLFIEMGQLKSDFDIEKFTVMKEGDFLAHQYHFLMRQYALTIYELRRMLLDKEEKERIIDGLKPLNTNKRRTILVITEKGEEEKYVDIEIHRLVNELDLLDITLQNKIKMCEYFEKVRLKLEEINGGRPPTNEDYQAEEPEYWKWFLGIKIIYQSRERATGIHQGVWENIDMVESKPIINPDFQRLMLQDMTDPSGNINLNKLFNENERRKGLIKRK